MFEKEINPYIDSYLQTLEKSKISKIIGYATKGGKCIRGFIVKHIIETIGKCEPSDIWKPITAVELIHASSLVIDDLPCMDNDNIRRGKPSVFVQFGKHEAILSSLFLISESVRLIYNSLDKNSTEHRKNTSLLINNWCELLSKNLVVGQWMDLQGDIQELFNIDNSKHLKNDNLIKFKTGSLFSFCFILGALFSENQNIDHFKEMGFLLGYMYQIMDDYKDRDTDNKNANYILSLGMDKAVTKYIESRTKLIILLQRYKLFTPEFQGLIRAMDTNFPRIFDDYNQLTSSN